MLDKKRSVSSITQYAAEHGLKYRKGWSEEDKEILRKYYPLEGYEGCREKFTGIHSKSQTLNECVLLDIKYIIWTDEELEILKEYYPAEGYKCINRMSRHHTSSSVQAMCSKLGLKMKDKKWKPEEDEIIIQYFPIGKAKLCYEKLNGTRTQSTIQNRASVLGLTTSKNVWSESDIQILKDYYSTEGADGCLKRLGNKYKRGTLIGKANTLGLQKDKNNFTAEENDIILKYYSTLGPKKIHEMYLSARSEGMITHQALKVLNIKCDKREIANCKPVINIETGEIFNSLTEASKSIGQFNKSSGGGAIGSAIKRNGTAGGYHWKYVEE